MSLIFSWWPHCILQWDIFWNKGNIQIKHWHLSKLIHFTIHIWTFNTFLNYLVNVSIHILFSTGDLLKESWENIFRHSKWTYNSGWHLNSLLYKAPRLDEFTSTNISWYNTLLDGVMNNFLMYSKHLYRYVYIYFHSE